MKSFESFYLNETAGQFMVKHALIREKEHHNSHWGILCSSCSSSWCRLSDTKCCKFDVSVFLYWQNEDFILICFFVRPFYLCQMSEFFFSTLRPPTLNFSFLFDLWGKPDPLTLKVNFVFVELISYRAYVSIISINFDEGIEKIIIGHKTNIRSLQIRSDFLK